jgi:hypothetical protein
MTQTGAAAFRGGLFVAAVFFPNGRSFFINESARPRRAGGRRRGRVIQLSV